MVQKSQIDRFFTKYDREITSIIESAASKSKAPNKENIKTELYLLCVEKREIITNLNLNWIKFLAATEYRWTQSKTNKNLTIFANEIDVNELNLIDDEYEENASEYEFAIAKYLLHAKPSERIFFELFAKKGIRTVRGVSKELNISHRSAWVLLKDFKTKIKSYVR